MTSLFTLVFLLSLPASAQPSDVQGTDTLQREVLRAQAIRFKAMVEVDLAALDDILADELTYTHTTGSTESKAEFLSTLESAAVKYESIEPDDVQVRIYDGTAVVTGRSAMRVIVHGEELSFSIRFIEVYRKAERNWQLVAWQSTRQELTRPNTEARAANS